MGYKCLHSTVKIIVQILHTFHLLGQTKLKCFWSSCLANILPSDNTQTDRKIITKRHHKGKYIYICTQ